MPLQQQILEAHPGPLAAIRAGARVKFRVVSMFSGCGGMDIGFRGGLTGFGQHYSRLPFEIVWANDLKEAACYWTQPTRR